MIEAAWSGRQAAGGEAGGGRTQPKLNESASRGNRRWLLALA